MVPMRHSTTPEGRERLWVGLARFVGLALLVMLFFLLAQSMVHNHFFSGGALNYHHRPTGP